MYFYLISVFLVINEINAQCWLSSYGRGVGDVLSACRSDQEKNGALCYPKCKSGYYGVGPVCWSICPSDHTDIGALCSRGADSKGKCCCVKFFSWTNGCCGGCPNGYTDMGCTCFRGVSTIAKSTYGRGVGSPLICPSNKVQNGALCYDSCRDGFNGIGPVCWGICPAYYGSQCGALCVKKASDCAMVFKDMSLGAVSQALNLVAIVGSAGTNLGAWVNTYSSTASLVVPMLNDVCGNPSLEQKVCIKATSCNGATPFVCGPLFCTSSQLVCAKAVIKISSEVTGVLGLFTGGAPTQNSAKIIEKVGKDASLFTKVLAWVKAANIATQELQQAGKVVGQIMSIVSGPLFSNTC